LDQDLKGELGKFKFLKNEIKKQSQVMDSEDDPYQSFKKTPKKA
jgi:hypothetical protein